MRKLLAALADQTGVLAHRSGALERIGFLLSDWQAAAVKLADTETRMTGVLDQLGLTELATSTPGVSTVGAAPTLAETGDPNRFASGRALVKHAGLAPREKLSGTFVRRTKLTGAGRPGLVLAAVERNLALLVTTLIYLMIALVPIDFGWTIATPSRWGFLPHLIIAGSVLLAAAIGFAAAQRHAQLEAA